MSQWCPADDWNTDTMITKICIKTKAALGIADDADCSTAPVLASADGDEWQSDEDDSTICDITSPDLLASECTGEGATFEIDTCGSSYDDLMLLFNTDGMDADCDSSVDLITGAGKYEDYLINKGCCASISTIFEYSTLQ